MLKLGEKQTLKILKIKEFGVYMGEDKDQEPVLLPKKQVPPGSALGDSVEVFIYRDSSDRLIATTGEPKITLGQVEVLTVKDVSKIGAFLDWGLEKDLFLPYKEQTEKVRPGCAYPVALYIDKSHRLCATMRLYEYLKAEAPYKKDDRVSGCIYQINDEFGAFVAVDNQYHGLIPAKEVHRKFKIGETIEARVAAVREDGKLELSVNQKKEIQMNLDSDKIINLLDSYDGVLPFTEKASPEVIERELGLSKAAFKRAVGRLLKGKKIEIDNGKIRKS